jgi:hypothetical protein
VKIYLVVHEVAYEGWAIVSAWTTREAADRECAGLVDAAGIDDYYDVEEVDVRADSQKEAP